MRIEQLTLKRYGHFTDFLFDFTQQNKIKTSTSGKTSTKPDFHILYGPNEAGKSTTLAAITDLLYGFERVTRWKFLHGNDLLEINAVLTQADKSVSIKRFKTHLSNDSNDRLTSLPLDLQGLSRDEYRQRFSFDEETLQKGGDQILNSQGDVGEALFSASSGLANFSNRLDSILTPSYNFWTPGRKSKLQLNDLKKALQENKSKLSKLKLDAKALQILQTDLSKATLELDEARNNKASITQEIKELEKKLALQDVARKWILRRESLEKLVSQGIITSTATQTIDLSSENKINISLDRIREIIQNNQIAESKLIDLRTELAKTKALSASMTLSDRERLYLNTKDALNKLTESASAAIEWEHQLRQIDSEIDQYDTLLNDHSQALGISENELTLESLPDDSQLNNIETLLTEHTSFSDRLQQAHEELKELEQHSKELYKKPASNDNPENISIISDVLRRVLHENLPEKYKSASNDALQAKKDLHTCAQSIGIAPNTIEQLQLPNQRIVFNLLDRVSEYQRVVQQLKYELQNTEDEISSTKQLISDLIKLGAIDNSTIDNSLKLRETAWLGHTNDIAAEVDYRKLKDSAERFEHALSSHDHLLSHALANIQQDTEIKLLEKQFNRLDETRNSISRKLLSCSSELEETTTELRILISSFYTEKSIDNELVREKLALTGKLKELHASSATHYLMTEDIRHQCKKQHAELLKVLSTIENESSLQQLHTLELQDLIVQAEKTVERKRMANEKLNAYVAERNSHEKNLKRTASKIEKYEQSLTQWNSHWTELSNQTVFSGLGMDAARKALPTVRNIRVAISQKAEANRKKIQLSNKIENRNTTLSSLLKKLTTSSLSNAKNELTSITQKSTDAIQQATQISKTELAIAETLDAGYQDSITLDSLCKECGVSTSEALIQLLQNTAKYRAMETLCSEEFTQMELISGSKQTPESIKQLFETFSNEETHAQLTKLTTELEQSETIYDERYGSWVLANKALHDVGDDNEFALLHQERANILLEIEEGAKNTAVALIGERILKTAISKFRQEHQSVLLSEAQDAFNTLTLGNYTHLIPRDDGRGNEKLFALDKYNKPRAVEELSTGTRYQLYLALRAAAHADYTRARTPLPFVADDIMESFDDERSAAAFSVLGKMALNGQVLYLTHHQHLIPIAKTVLGAENVQVHHLSH